MFTGNLPLPHRLQGLQWRLAERALALWEMPTVTVSTLIDKLALASAASAQAMTNFRIKLVGDQMTAQLNKKIAQFKAQSTDSTIPRLQAQSVALTKQQAGYDAARGQFSQNGVLLSDLTLNLGTLATAAQAGDAAKFDAILQAANNDVDRLAVVGFLPGFQPDGVVPLKTKRLGIQSSATYDLSTPSGQAQAVRDVQAAQVIEGQVFAQTSQNQKVADSISQALQGQVKAISDQVSQRQFNTLSTAAIAISNLKQRSQEQFHLIELAFSTAGQTASILTSVQNATNIAPPPGTILSLLVGSTGPLSLGIGTLTTTGTIGSTISTKA
jgi:hypothetical protein